MQQRRAIKLISDAASKLGNDSPTAPGAANDSSTQQPDPVFKFYDFAPMVFKKIRDAKEHLNPGQFTALVSEYSDKPNVGEHSRRQA